VYDKNNIPLSDVVAQVLAQFAARENATVEDVIALARQLPGALSLAPQSRPAQMPTRVSDETIAPRPAVAIDQSVSDETVTCLCCGKSFTMLKRHLKAEHGLTEGQYRAQFGLDEPIRWSHPTIPAARQNTPNASVLVNTPAKTRQPKGPVQTADTIGNCCLAIAPVWSFKPLFL